MDSVFYALQQVNKLAKEIIPKKVKRKKIRHSHDERVKQARSNVYIQKQPPEVFCKKRWSYKFHKIHRKTSASESLF